MHPQTIDTSILVADSSSVWERLERGDLPAADSDPERAAKRLERWKTTRARDHTEYFARRLDWSQVSEKRLLPILDRVVLCDESRLPRWTRILAAISANARRHSLSGTPDTTLGAAVFRAEDPVPMEEFFYAHLLVARSELLENLAEQNLASQGRLDPRLASEKVLDQLLRGLLTRLSEASIRTLFAEFALFKAAVEKRDEPVDAQPKRHHYDNFRQALAADDFSKLYASYPVLFEPHP